MERDQATEQQNRRKGVGVFTPREQTTTEQEQSTELPTQRKGIGIFQRPLRTAGFPLSLVVAVVIIIALVILVVVVF